MSNSEKNTARKAKGESGSRSPTSLVFRLMAGLSMSWKRRSYNCVNRDEKKSRYLLLPGTTFKKERKKYFIEFLHYTVHYIVDEES